MQAVYVDSTWAELKPLVEKDPAYRCVSLFLHFGLHSRSQAVAQQPRLSLYLVMSPTFGLTGIYWTFQLPLSALSCCIKRQTFDGLSVRNEALLGSIVYVLDCFSERQSLGVFSER
jgi:hypothetical protein